MAPAKVEEAVLKAAAGHFQLACASAWEGKHSCACDSGINHPNQVCAHAPGDDPVAGRAAARAALPAPAATCAQRWAPFRTALDACICCRPPALQYFEESRKALEGEQGSDGGAPGAAAAGAGAPPKTPAGAAPAATRQLQDVLGSNGAQPSGGAAKVQRTG